MKFSFTDHAIGFQSKEQTLLILTYELGMARYYCEQKGWDFQALMQLGEEAYLERMEDIKKHGKK